VATEHNGSDDSHRSTSRQKTNGTHTSGEPDQAGPHETGERNRPIYPSVSRIEARPAGDTNPMRKPAMSAKNPDGDLVASAGVKLKGEIASCNTLTVEGEVRAQACAQQIVVANSGYFIGKAEVGDAEISGLFEGTLRASGKVVIRRSGRVNGTVSYGQLEIEPGGELKGNVAVKFDAGKQGLLHMSPAEKFWPRRS